MSQIKLLNTSPVDKKQMNKDLITKINQSGYKAYFAITGGGASFIGNYLSVSGGSNFVVGANIPYSQAQFDKFVGKVDFKYCSEEAARKLATCAFVECLNSGITRDKALGIGVTCSLAKDNEREGRENKGFICLHCEDLTIVRRVAFDNKERERQEAIVVEFILNLIAYRLGLEEQRKWFCEDTIIHKKNNCDIAQESKTLVIYSGSFNPLHDGHLAIVQRVKQILGQEPILEITRRNSDKGELDHIEISKRIEAIEAAKLSYYIGDAAKFDEKVDYYKKLYPNKSLIFVVGVDTWNRIWDISRYSFEELMAQWKKWDMLSIKFMVFPRNGIAPIYYVNNFWDEVIPALCLMSHSTQLKDFNMRISSTEIRKKNSETA